MFNREELTVIIQSLSALDIKGSDAIYMATLISKVNGEVNKIDEEADKKAALAKEIIEKDKKDKK
jgi:hypothetical protein